ncbi:MAG: hypothetical protein FJ109_03585 [Deltaproteobacteria bacterium]|nr:hypothetical protein [Deltaproteobacteria bacterium]
MKDRSLLTAREETPRSRVHRAHATGVSGPLLAAHCSLLLLLLSCAEDAPRGLAPATADPEAARVVFDLDGEPLPEIPLPNDLATRLDPTAPGTGRRLNVTIAAPTRVERDVRRRALLNNGFGTYMPITVSFTEPLSIDNLVKRHTDNVDFADDAVYVVDITRSSPDFGKPVPLDFGAGNFPLILPTFDRYFENDPRAATSNLLFETEDEDVNGNGRLDPGEDTDHDGLLDLPNVHPDGGDPVDDLLVFYEKQTDTLILRPVVPLRQETTYAVVLTKRLIDKKSKAVASPFPYINHLQQNEALEPLPEVLDKGKWGVKLADVAFAWTFTTQSVTRDLEALREGLYGRGPFGWLAGKFPVDRIKLHKIRGPGGQPAFAVDFQSLADALSPLVSVATTDPSGADQLVEDLKNIDYAIAGTFQAPFFLEDKDGIATPNYPSDEDEAFDIDRTTGRATPGARWIPFLCTIPKKAKSCAGGTKPLCKPRRTCTDGVCEEKEVCRCQPYPVVVYIHGYGGLKFEALGFAGRQAAHGLAVCALDAHGHGVDLTKLTINFGDDTGKLLVADLLVPFLDILDIPGLMDVLSDQRARDLNNDGIPDPAADFWTYDVFHTRDVVRQTVVDHLQFIRMLKSFDGESMLPLDTDGDGKPDLAGDFDGNGAPDLGGPDVRYFAWGQSMGGIVSPMLAAIEPSIDGVAPVAGGAGLFDLSIRSTNPGVPEAVFLPLFGPLVVGSPAGDDGTVRFSFVVQDVEDNFPIRKELHLHETRLDPGDRVLLRNTVNGETDEAIVDAGRRIRLAVPADALSPSEKHHVTGMDETCSNCPVAVTDTAALGDTLEIEIYEGSSEAVRERIDQFMIPVEFQGVTYTSGSPLVAPVTGFGLKRGTPKLRRFLSFASMFIEPGDPVGYVPHLVHDPLPAALAESSDKVYAEAWPLFIPTAGDMNVPVSSELAMARAAGAVGLFEPSKDRCVQKSFCDKAGKHGRKNGYCRYGVGTCLTENQVLLGGFVPEGLARLSRFDVSPWNDAREVLLDVDDLDGGKLPWPECTRTDQGEVCSGTTDAPDLADLGWKPLRMTRDDGRWGVRIFFAYISDRHGFDPPSPSWPVDMNTYFGNLVSSYFYRIASGKDSSAQYPWIVDDPCLAASNCPFFP